MGDSFALTSVNLKHMQHVHSAEPFNVYTDNFVYILLWVKVTCE